MAKVSTSWWMRPYLFWCIAISGWFYFQAHFKVSAYPTFLHEIIPGFSFPSWPKLFFVLFFWSHALFYLVVHTDFSAFAVDRQQVGYVCSAFHSSQTEAYEFLPLTPQWNQRMKQNILIIPRPISLLFFACIYFPLVTVFWLCFCWCQPLFWTGAENGSSSQGMVGQSGAVAGPSGGISKVAKGQGPAEKEEQAGNQKRARRQWESWSAEDKNSFFEGLYEVSRKCLDDRICHLKSVLKCPIFYPILNLFYCKRLLNSHLNCCPVYWALCLLRATKMKVFFFFNSLRLKSESKQRRLEG